MMGRRRSNAGISQLEMLTALALMTMMAIIISNALDFNRRSLSASYGAQTETDRYFLIEQIRDWVAAMPRDGVGNDRLYGTRNSLQFVSWVPRGQFWHLHPVNFKVLLEHKQLVVRTTGAHPRQHIPIEVNFVVATQVDSLEIGYFGRKSDQTESKWHENWEQENQLPDLIKLSWKTSQGYEVPVTLLPANDDRQRYISLSSLVPPG